MISHFRLPLLVLTAGFLILVAVLSYLFFHQIKASTSTEIHLTGGSDANHAVDISSSIKSAPSGAIIYLMNGYYKAFNISRDNLSVIAPGHKAIITGTIGAGNGLRVEQGSSNILIDGVVTNNKPNEGIFIGASNHVTVRNCESSNNGGTARDHGGNGHGGLETGESNYILVENCIFANSLGHGIYFGAYPSDHLIARHNLIYNDDICIQINAESNHGVKGERVRINDVLIDSNICLNSTVNDGFNLAGVMNSTFRNNVISSRARGGIALWHGDGHSTANPDGNKFYNNIIYEPNGWAFSFDGIGNNNVYKNNLIVSKTNDAPMDNTNYTGGSGSMFVKPDGKESDVDLHFKSASAGAGAIDKGADLSSNWKTDLSDDPGILNDADGNIRPINGKWDIGAYEFGGGSVTPTPTPKLTPTPTPPPTSGDVNLQISNAIQTFRSGDQSMMTLSYKNGTNKTMTNAIITLTLPNNFTSDTGQSAATINLGSLAAGASGTKTIHIRLK